MRLVSEKLFIQCCSIGYLNASDLYLEWFKESHLFPPTPMSTAINYKKTSLVPVKHLFEMVKCYWYKDNARTSAYKDRVPYLY